MKAIIVVLLAILLSSCSGLKVKIVDAIEGDVNECDLERTKLEGCAVVIIMEKKI